VPGVGADRVINEHELYEGLRDIMSRRTGIPIAKNGPRENPTSEPAGSGIRNAYLLRAALAICDAHPSLDFVNKLDRLGNGINLQREAEMRHPGRPEQRAALKQVIRAARWIARVRHTIAEPMRVALNDVISLAEAALVRVSKEKKQGQTKFYAQETIGNAKDICALVIQVAWHHCRGRWPHDKEAKAIVACDFLWGAAGGDVQRRRSAAKTKRVDSLGLSPDELEGKGEHRGELGPKEVEQLIRDAKREDPANSIWVRHMRVARRQRTTANAQMIRSLLMSGKSPRKLTPEQQRARDEIIAAT
jgi:hypothetical protein